MKKNILALGVLLLYVFCTTAQNFVKDDFLSGYTIGDNLDKYVYKGTKNAENKNVVDSNDPVRINQWNGFWRESFGNTVPPPKTSYPLVYRGYAGTRKDVSFELPMLRRGNARQSIYSLTDDKTPNPIYNDGAYYLAFLIKIHNGTNSGIEQSIITLNGNAKGDYARTCLSVNSSRNHFNFALTDKDHSNILNKAIENTERNYDEIYLVVIKHDFTKKTASLFVNPNTDKAEPTPTVIIDSPDLKSIRGISVKNRSSHHITISGIRFANNWTDVISKK